MEQREIKAEPILYALIKARENKAAGDISKEIKVNKELCRKIGIFSYTTKYNGNILLRQLYVINETQDGESVNIIYDENGKYIGLQNEKDRENNEIQVAKDVELNSQNLAKQLEMSMEIGENNTENGSPKSGDGRDLASKEHEEVKNDVKSETKEKSKDGDEKEEIKEDKEKTKTKLKNLKDDIDLYYAPKIPLNLNINGYWLWQILQIEKKLEGRLPQEIDKTEFRDGYLSIINSDKLSSKDGKTRKPEDTYVIVTRSGDIVELDEEILKPVELGTIDERIKSENTRHRYEDGKETPGPSSPYALTRTSMYQIQNVSEEFKVPENWFLAVDKNREYMIDGKQPANGYSKNVSFAQNSRNQSQYEREDRPQNTVEYKLDPIRETSYKEEEEIKKDAELANRDPNEVENIILNHKKELVDECFAKYKDLRFLL